MKSLSHIYENVVDFNNIVATMYTSMKGKKKTKSINEFLSYNHICENAERIKQGLMDGTLPTQSKRTAKNNS